MYESENTISTQLTPREITIVLVRVKGREERTRKRKEKKKHVPWLIYPESIYYKHIGGSSIYKPTPRWTYLARGHYIIRACTSSLRATHFRIARCTRLTLIDAPFAAEKQAARERASGMRFRCSQAQQQPNARTSRRLTRTTGSHILDEAAYTYTFTYPSVRRLAQLYVVCAWWGQSRSPKNQRK